MLKWFRKYNKYILAVGASLLMIAFLVPQSLQMLGESGRNYTIGTIGDDEIKVNDQRAAAVDLQLLSVIFSRVHPQLANFAVQASPIEWLLMHNEAGRMRLSAGDNDAHALLTQMGYDDTEKMNDLLKTTKVGVEDIYRVVADWITIESYKELVTGRTHTPVADRVGEYLTWLNYLAGGQIPPMYVIPKLIEASQGKPRMSEPVLMRAVADQASQASIEAVAVAIDPYLNDVQAPTSEKLGELFDKYKSDLPGEGKPYGFGYRFPDRVKIEYLSIPFDRVEASVRVDESEAVRYYDQNPDEFTVTPSTQPEDGDAEVKPAVKRYAQVRGEILDKLKRQEATKIARQMASRAQSLLQEQMRQLSRKDKDGYRELSADFVPAPLKDIAVRMQEQFNVLPNVTVLDSAWLTEQSLATVPGIGTSRLSNNARTSFVDYALGVRECKREDYVGPRLQAGLPSLTLSGFDGSHFIFRVIEAQPSRDPTSLDEVRDSVVQDARRLAAYEKLVAERSTWQKRLTDAADMTKLAEQLNTTVIAPQPFARRTAGMFGGPAQVPTLDAIGSSEAVVDQVFELANKLAAESGGKVQELPAAQRSLTVANDANMTLYLIRLTNYQPLKRSDYERIAATGQAAQSVQQSLMRLDEPLEPFGYDALVRRTGYQANDE